jgi:hypothetical protein
VDSALVPCLSRGPNVSRKAPPQVHSNGLSRDTTRTARVGRGIYQFLARINKIKRGRVDHLVHEGKVNVQMPNDRDASLPRTTIAADELSWAGIKRWASPHCIPANTRVSWIATAHLYLRTKGPHKRVRGILGTVAVVLQPIEASAMVLRPACLSHVLYRCWSQTIARLCPSA